MGIVVLLQSWSTTNDIKAFCKSELLDEQTSYNVNPDQSKEYK